MSKVSQVIQNVLSDALYETVIDPFLAAQRIRFVQKLVEKFPDLNSMIDLNEEWNKFEMA
jgi:hypothetical protein